jgi:hypothetical protein
VTILPRMLSSKTPRNLLKIEALHETRGSASPLHAQASGPKLSRSGVTKMDDPRTRRILIALVIGIILFAAGMAQHYWP